MKLKIRNIDECNIVAEKILKTYPSQKVFAFYGIMGAGKTTLIKSFCSFLGSEDISKSPSFAIINEYSLNSSELKETNKIYHFDFYRIQKEEEAYDIGYEEYFYSDNYCFIEWPERIEKLLPQEYIRIDISEADNGERVVNCSLI